MNRGLALLGGLGLGAGLMYILDPAQGRRRRALVRDKAASAAGRIGDAVETTARDISQRARGLIAEARSQWSGGTASDDVLAERVRSLMGRCISHPGSVEVRVNNGRVTLSGPVLEREVADLLACVEAVPGVSGVDNRLEIHQRSGNVPGLQGGRGRPGARFDLPQRNWSPATRFLVGTAGLGLLANGLARPALPSALLGTLGFGIFLRAASNRELLRLVGVRGGRGSAAVQKAITIHAPVDRVYQFWSDFQNFPRFMEHVREVRDLGGGRSHWVVDGPAGMPVSWNAVITRQVPNELLAWKSETGAVIPNAGTVRFEPAADDATRVNICLAYSPPGGALGHLAATLFGADPRSRMDEDLVRLQSLLEEGRTSAPGKQATQEEMAGAGAGWEQQHVPEAGGMGIFRFST